ncbi:hypothetical protein [Aquiflexum gelatinilyticum]|uniref:Uncharacterized protein n=1 Tax=Aquiflexum gelatinilyticum TaxID=2961943 RepID=A0A9X2SXH9_9BACT|nr:hypothetical protein [Aquiflexum gelatinilyticum]MCR9013877.1 hypothetical protein [Aquiflexum gelatinilyticum]
MFRSQAATHSFHIPVMGLGFTADTPIKVAKYGISSVVSIMDDHMLEDLRRIYSRKLQIPYLPISDKTDDSRANRIKAYLNLIHDAVSKQIEELKSQSFEYGIAINEYFTLLPENHGLKVLYEKMKQEVGEAKAAIQSRLKAAISPGKIDVNIMTKVDKINFDKEGNELPREYSDALSALRGFAESELESSVVFSAGMNPSLYGYAEQFADFFPDQNGKIKKGIILKVSDYRSALIQGRFLAKKGLWVSEFRIESGLNCGGHAFATDGLLIGPILEEFKNNRAELRQVLFDTCQKALTDKGSQLLSDDIMPKITYQGGIGSAAEDKFLMNYYQLDGTGWGSPFLLVPEATSVDKDTLDRLIQSRKSDYYLSHASPLGVPFNNLRTSSGEEQRLSRIEKNRPGSPCYKKFLSFSTEFSSKPICTASREYQNLKLKQYAEGNARLPEVEEVLEKDCLCEGLSASVILNQGEEPKRNLKAVTICPGPNLAYFKGVFSLKEMLDHIYGKANIILDPERPQVFVKELQLYVQHLQHEIGKSIPERTQKFEVYVEKFKSNLSQGIAYYQELIASFPLDTEEVVEKMRNQLSELKEKISSMELVKA